ncbi:MAG TPA: hypothetical protein VG244_13950 [Acidimicrobiales bacterium]|jgi:hypothetical protein|nr:hypothetical protein [Acidimicrobiales bacterium]
MAYVVARPKGRFEIRESVHTANGPRARSLANFAALTDEVLETARLRASRPFDARTVRASARRAGSPVRRSSRRPAPRAPGVAPALSPAAAQRFVEASRRAAASFAAVGPIENGDANPRDPGDVLIDLLGFAEAVQPFTPRRQAEPLAFPPLNRLVAERTRERPRRRATRRVEDPAP